MLLERYRVKKGLSYDALALQLGMSKNMVWRICRDRASCIKLADAQKIVQGTSGEVTFEELLDTLGDC